MAIALLVAVIGFALAARNFAVWKGFPLTPPLVYDNYWDDRCLVRSVYETMPRRYYGVELESQASKNNNHTNFAAIDFGPYKAQLDNNRLNDTELRRLFPQSLVVNSTVPCIYPIRCAKSHEWMVADGRNSPGGGNAILGALTAEKDCTILTNVTSDQLPHASVTAAITGYALIGIGGLAFLILCCVFLCTSSCCC